MRVAAVQYKPIKGRKAESLSALAVLADRAARGSDLVVLPEMAATGYLFDGPAAIAPVAEVAEGETFRALAPVARANRCWIVAGFPERAGDLHFNSATVIDPTGALAFTYRKTLLYDADLPWATPGDSGYRRFDADTGAFTVGICMDLNDDRFVAWCAASAARVVALPTNWIEQGVCTWPYWVQRMEGVPSALVAANTWGPEGTVGFSGESAIVDDGTVLAAAPWTGDAVIRATLRR